MHKVLAFLWLCILTGAVSLSLTAQDSKKQLHALGTLEITAENAEFVPSELQVLPGYYCVGTKDLPGHQCFTYTYLDRGIDLKTVQVAVENGNILRLSLVQRVNDEAVKVISPAAAPTPNMDPVPLQLKKKKQATEESQNENDEEEAEKSWIQKNWMYIVPPLMILMMLLPEEEKKQE